MVSAAGLFADQALFQAVDTADAAQRDLWQRCELAIFAEHRLAILIDPGTLTRGAFARLCRQALAEDETLSDLTRPTFFHPFWIRAGRQTAGIIAFSLVCHSRAPFIQLWDFYLLPAFRGRGLGRTVLDTIFAAVAAQGFSGFRLSTEWIYQSAVRYYLRQGLWLTGWKRHLDFARYQDLPRFRCQLRGDGRIAQFVIEAESDTVLYSARRNGPGLKLYTLAPAHRLNAGHSLLPHYALCTFSLWLALNGWPLVRSLDAWGERLRYSDGGMPEGLAYKIELFEARARAQGFAVRAARIPGLLYRDWQALMKE